MVNTKILINGGIKIHYTIKHGTKGVLFFIHGGGGSLSAWDFILPLFKHFDYKLITVDLRGHGYSGRPKNIYDYDYEKHITDIYAILEKENIKKVIFVGHCMGGMIASTFAFFHPERVEKLIIINTGAELPWFVNRILKPFFWIIALLISKISSPRGQGRVDYTLYQGTGDLSIRRQMADFKVMGLYSVTSQLLGAIRWEGRKYFQGIQCPVLFIIGRKDLLFPPFYMKSVARLFKNYKLVYIDSNHISVINAPKAVYDTIIEFL